MKQRDLLEEKILRYIISNLSANDIIHSLGVVAKAKHLARSEKLGENDTRILVYAAYLHDITKRKNKDTHPATGGSAARALLSSHGFLSAGEVEKIIRCHHEYGDIEKEDSPRLSLLLIKADMLEQLHAAGRARMIAQNSGQGYEKCMDELACAVKEAGALLKAVNAKLFS